MSAGHLPVVMFGCALLAGCTGVEPRPEEPYAEIDADTTPSCSTRSVRLSVFKSGARSAAPPIALPFRVRPGTYTIAIACNSVKVENTELCVDAAEIEARREIPPYDLVLKPEVRYVFSCRVVKGKLQVQVKEVSLGSSGGTQGK